MSGATFIVALVAIAIALSLIMTLAWLVEQRTGNSGWIDTVWTFGMGAVGIAAALAPLPGEVDVSARQWLIAVAVLLWSLRLGSHIWARSAGRGDDPRYAQLRAAFGEHARWRMWVLVQQQAIVCIPLAMTILLAAHHPARGWRMQDVLAAIILIVAIVGEAMADRQLRQFMRSASDRHAVCDVGLWRWSRHPNYFFEWLTWVAYAVVAIDFSGNYLVGWLALAGPACMYWLLVYVSGIPPLEAHMVRTRGDAFLAYRARTSVFFPLPPRNSS